MTTIKQIRAQAKRRVTISRARGVTSKQVRAIINRGTATDLDANVQTSVNLGFDTTAANLVFQLSSVTTGEGTKHQLMRSESRILLTNAASAGAATVRLIFFQWFADSTVDSPIPSDILNDSNTVDAILSPIVTQATNAGRFKILRDMHITLGEATSVEGNNTKFRRVMFFKFPRKFLMNTASAEGKNNLFMLGISNVADASTPPTIQMQTGVRVKDVRK